MRNTPDNSLANLVNGSLYRGIGMLAKPAICKIELAYNTDWISRISVILETV